MATSPATTPVSNLEIVVTGLDEGWCEPTPAFRTGDAVVILGEGLDTAGFVSFQETRLETLAFGRHHLAVLAPPIDTHAALGHLWVHRGQDEVRGPLIVVLSRPAADTEG